jgi:hypothetical protein
MALTCRFMERLPNVSREGAKLLKPLLLAACANLALTAQVGRGYVDEVLLRGMAMLPVDRITRGIRESLQLAEGFSQHGRVVGPVDDPVAPLVLLQQGRRKPVIWAS